MRIIQTHHYVAINNNQSVIKCCNQKVKIKLLANNIIKELKSLEQNSQANDVKIIVQLVKIKSYTTNFQSNDGTNNDGLYNIQLTILHEPEYQLLDQNEHYIFAKQILPEQYINEPLQCYLFGSLDYYPKLGEMDDDQNAIKNCITSLKSSPNVIYSIKNVLQCIEHILNIHFLQDTIPSLLNCLVEKAPQVNLWVKTIHLADQKYNSIEPEKTTFSRLKIEDNSVEDDPVKVYSIDIFNEQKSALQIEKLIGNIRRRMIELKNIMKTHKNNDLEPLLNKLEAMFIRRFHENLTDDNRRVYYNKLHILSINLENFNPNGYYLVQDIMKREHDLQPNSDELLSITTYTTARKDLIEYILTIGENQPEFSLPSQEQSFENPYFKRFKNIGYGIVCVLSLGLVPLSFGIARLLCNCFKTNNGVEEQNIEQTDA